MSNSNLLQGHPHSILLLDAAATDGFGHIASAGNIVEARCYFGEEGMIVVMNKPSRYIERNIDW